MSVYGSLVADGVAILIMTSLVDSLRGNLPFHPPLAVRPAHCLSLLKPKIINRNTCIYLISFSSFFYLLFLLFLPPSRASLSGLLPAALQVIYYEWRHCCSQECTLQYGCGAFDRLYSSAAALFPACAIL